MLLSFAIERNRETRRANTRANHQALGWRAGGHYTAMNKQECVKPAVDAKTLNDTVERVRHRPRPATNHPWKRWQGATPNSNPPQALPSSAASPV